MMERAAEFSQSTTDATPDKNRTEHSPKTPRAGKKQNKAVESSRKLLILLLDPYLLFSKSHALSEKNPIREGD